MRAHWFPDLAVEETLRALVEEPSGVGERKLLARVKFFGALARLAKVSKTLPSVHSCCFTTTRSLVFLRR
jgi:hypothetical protein